MRKIPLIKPYINQAIKDKVIEVLDSGFLTEGSVTRDLENTFCNYTGAAKALAFTSCTTGLETALRALKVGVGDEIIIPDYTYPATADAVSIVGATTVIVDVDVNTMLIDYDQIEKAITTRTKAIVPVSIFGNPLDYGRLNAINQKYGVFIVEDAACSIGATYDGKFVGTLADISVFSMHPRKFITTGEGGMVTTNNVELAQWMSAYKHFGMGEQGARLDSQFNQIGTNYKLSDILAAVGLEQMRHIGMLLERRRTLSSQYIQMIESVDHVQLPAITGKGQHAYQSFCVLIDNRNEVMQKLHRRGVEVQIGTYALHMQPAFQANSRCRIEGDMRRSRYLFDHVLTLPLYHDLDSDDQQYIIRMLREAINREKQ